MSYICEADETYCRAGARSRRNLSDKCHFNAKQINFSVGYGIYDVPDACFIIPFSAKQKNHIVGEGCSPLGRRHEVTEGEASPPRNDPPDAFPNNQRKMRSKSNISVGMVIDHPQNDGRFIDRKH